MTATLPRAAKRSNPVATFTRSLLAAREQPPESFKTWGPAQLNAPASDHEATSLRLIQAGYTFSWGKHPERPGINVYLLNVIFDIHKLGVYEPA
jgi:hypothetical protein